MSGDYISSSSSRGERDDDDDDDEDRHGMENGHRVAGVVLNPFFVPASSGRHSLIHDDTSNNGRAILVAQGEDSSINSRSELDNKDTGQSSSP